VDAELGTLSLSTKRADSKIKSPRGGEKRAEALGSPLPMLMPLSPGSNGSSPSGFGVIKAEIKEQVSFIQILLRDLIQASFFSLLTLFFLPPDPFFCYRLGRWRNDSVSVAPHPLRKTKRSVRIPPL